MAATTTPTKAGRTRQYIIECAAPVFNIKGYAGTSLNDVITATGLTKGSVYGNFANKDELALAAFDYNFQSISNHLKQQMAAHPNAIDKLLVYPEAYRNFYQKPFLRAGCPILNTATEVDDTHPLLKEKVSHALKTWKNRIERVIQQGVENKEMKAPADVNEFIAVFIALIEGGILQTKATGSPFALNASMNYLEKMIQDLKT